jgi:phosphohistidine swiveling domain-containing protein
MIARRREESDVRDIGSGLTVSGTGTVGVLHAANDTGQVFALLRHEHLEEVILLTNSASATALVPLLAKVRGVVCRSGGMTSHLAIVSREFGIACLMGAELPSDEELEGAQIRIDEHGAIHRVE